MSVPIGFPTNSSAPPLSPRIQEICRINQELQSVIKALNTEDNKLRRNELKKQIATTDYNMKDKTVKFIMGNGDTGKLAEALYPNDVRAQSKYMQELFSVFL
jgi:hypothetical protein